MDPAKYQHVVDIDALFYAVLSRVQVELIFSSPFSKDFN